MCRPWKRVGFGRLASGYSVVTRGPNSAWRRVTANPPHLLTGDLPPIGEDLDGRPAGARPVRHREVQNPVDGEGAERRGQVDPRRPVLVLRHPVGRRYRQPQQSERDPDLPGQVHQLVVAEPGQGGPEPDVAEEE